MRNFFLALLLCWTVSSFSNPFSYRIVFFGIDDAMTLSQLKKSCSLLSQTSSPPQNIQGLRYLLREDHSSYVKVLHSRGYYDATVTFQIEEGPQTVTAFILIDPGIQYYLGSFSILDQDCNKSLQIPLEKLNIQLNAPAIAGNLLNAKNYLLKELAQEGYPLAKMAQEKYLAEIEEKKIYATLCVNTGPLCRFGTTTINGLGNVKSRFIARKIAYKEGDVFSLEAIDKTRKQLINTDLFSSVLIDHANTLDDWDLLPMNIHFTEAKHQTFSAGISYATVDGFGINLGWIHRNMRGMGERLSFNANFSQKKNVGIASYAIPDFGPYGKEYILQGEALREDIYPYLAFSYLLNSRMDQMRKKTLFSYGVQGEYTTIHESANNGKFWVASLPIFIRHSTTNNLLNPTQGYQIVYRITPNKSFSSSPGLFLQQTLLGQWYIPTAKVPFLVLATRVQLGSVAGTHYRNIPMTKLFLGGSDDDLRGYKYRSVSPKDSRGKPLGGRSAIYVSFEPRFRLSRSFGLVPFTDWGNIRKKMYPTWKGKWHKSVGLGFRYFSFFGPIRLDVACPLNRGSHDHKYKIYVSLGQTF
ncbi:MAG: BamA/TamA family outer membrane protein [Parachlamydiales bacterium]|nr:BamA/TamA family outer membrane protein [Parachlamydiales bacterium]